MNNDLDENLRKVFHNNRSSILPDSTQHSISEALKNIKTQNIKTKKHFIGKVAACCAICLISCSVVFAVNYKDIKNKIFNYDIDGSKGIQYAAEKGYIQNVEMNYIESDNVKFKIDYITMDDTNLALNFNFLLDYDASNFKGIAINNIKIYDDSNKLIHTEEERFPNDGITLGAGFIKPVYVNGNNVIESFLVRSDHFPKTKNLRITFDSIVLYNENNGKPITKVLNGNFDFVVELDEKFYNRTTKEYNIKSIENNDNIVISKVFLTNTSFNIIIDNPEIHGISIELYSKNGEKIYSKEEILLSEINDLSKRKIGIIDILPGIFIDDEMELVIKGYIPLKESIETTQPIEGVDYVVKNAKFNLKFAK